MTIPSPVLDHPFELLEPFSRSGLPFEIFFSRSAVITIRSKIFTSRSAVQDHPFKILLEPFSRSGLPFEIFFSRDYHPFENFLLPFSRHANPFGINYQPFSRSVSSVSNGFVSRFLPVRQPCVSPV